MLVITVRLHTLWIESYCGTRHLLKTLYFDKSVSYRKCIIRSIFKNLESIFALTFAQFLLVSSLNLLLNGTVTSAKLQWKSHC